jgi:hemolysin activation/secretion protein
MTFVWDDNVFAEPYHRASFTFESGHIAVQVYPPLGANRLRQALTGFLAATVLATAHPGKAASLADGSDPLIRQQQRERAQQERQEQSPDVRLELGDAEASGLLPSDETPCFRIERIHLKGAAAEQFEWALNAAAANNDPPLGRCLGANGINLVMKRIQNAIIERGYITSRVLAEPQDIKSGTLELTVIPGRVRAIRLTPESGERATFWNTFPIASGDLLNLRDIEQALENLKRVPTVEADIQVVPSEGSDPQPGDSDLLVSWKQAFPLRLTFSVDNTGSKSTGKEQGGVTLSADHLMGMHDLFYLSFNRDLFGNQSQHGTRGNTVHYSIPFGYWQVGVTHSTYTYYQSVAGASQTYTYSGESSNSDLRLSRLVWRDATSKTTVGVRGWQRSSHNFIDDTEVEVQQRRMAGWEINLSERLFIKEATLDASIAYRRGTGAMNALEAPEQAIGEGTSRLRLITADAQFNQAFAIAAQRLRYALTWRAQWNDTPLVPQDRFAIGGHYTVRGFDGEQMLSAERGWLLRNDLAAALGNSGQEAYLGIDYGRVGGASAALLVGNQLAGAVIGLRGNLQGLTYDVYIGKPIDKPDYFRTATNTKGFTLNWSF